MTTPDIPTVPDSAAWSPRSPAERVLMALKMHGALTAAALGERLGTTGEAARQQLLRLEAEGLVCAAAAAEAERRGVGRPVRRWRLTPEAQARFPDTHAAVTVQILELVGAQLGEAALDAVIAAREAETRAGYAAAMADVAGLPDRVQRLTELRAAEGYMPEWRSEPDGTLVLIENHCPICAAATACQGFCRSELETFSALLGPGAEIERAEHIVDGGRRCTYLIRETSR